MRAAPVCFSIALGLGACFSPQLGGLAAPFACADGACPDGFRCAQQLCIAESAPDPPILIGTTTIDVALPRAVRGAQQFAVFWQQNVEAGTLQESLHLTQLGAAGAADQSLTAVTGSAFFDALYDASASLYVFAVATNGEDAPALRVSTLAADGTGQRQIFALTEQSSPIGFSAPSLAIVPGGDQVTLAYTFSSPPRVDKDNVSCTRIDVGTMAADPSCTPTVAQTMGEYAVDVAVAETPGVTTLFWRSGDLVRITQRMNDMPVATRTIVDVAAVGHVATIASTLALTEEHLDNGALTWNVAVRKGSSSLNVPVSSFAEPDITSDGKRLILCVQRDDGEIEVRLRSLDDLAEIGTPMLVPRLSRAAIAGCRIAAAQDSTEIAVAWKELIPPSAARIYAATMTLPAP